MSSQVPAMMIDELAERRLEILVRELMVLLQEHEAFVLEVDYVEDVETWRKAVRSAGRRLGVPVRTGVSKDGTRVWAADVS
ncbi:MAG: hypothetical protein ACRDZ8_17255 [Acidimicrobiales bacterium]